MVTVNYSDLESALLYVSAGELVSGRAHISKIDGNIYFESDDEQDELPEDINDPEGYVEVPHRQELNLGHHLVLDFVAQRLPECFREVECFFRKRGAYSRFKELLFRHDMLQEWYDFETQKTKLALSEWCAENNLKLVDGSEKI